MKNPFTLILYFSIIVAVIILGLFALKNINYGSSEAAADKKPQNKEIIYPKGTDVIITSAEINDGLKTKLPPEIKKLDVSITKENVTLVGEYLKVIPLKFVIVGKPELLDEKIEVTIEKAEIVGTKMPSFILNKINEETAKYLSQYTSGKSITNIRLEEDKIILNLKEY